ncbi:NtaA/DmoA family FMN-dependent monooxygenase [Kribbella sp. NPDC050820]|uniref:NtaA/DmoA family FMN-dependent monooxygenase n=1 Tax=Kribbella sp. NPDC050820 TaxID=3155408 RepID=UPI00340E5FC0
MYVNVLTQCTPGPLFEGLWRHRGDDSGTGYRELAHWTRIARRLDDGGVDALFFADITGTFQTRSSGFAASVRHAVQIPAIDPLLVVPALAAATSRLGFAVTYSTSTHHPYDCARVFSTLDHLTAGRIAWNLVTSDQRLTGPTGMSEPADHDERYDRAEEFLLAAVALWENSWDDEAVRRDAASDVFADPDHVRPIHHHGKWFDLDVPHQCEPSPQRTPVIYQAGASPRGQRFAATFAEVVFIVAPGFREAAEQVTELRRLAGVSGRAGPDLKIVQGLSLLLGRDDAEVRQRAREFAQWTSPGGLLAKWCGWTGVDLGSYPPDKPLAEIDPADMLSVKRFLGGLSDDRPLTVLDLIDRIATQRQLHRFSPMSLVGTPAQVADRMEQWLERTGIDGFNLSPIPGTSGVDDLCDLLMPELRRRGLIRTDDVPMTLRERYQGNQRYSGLGRAVR